MERRLLKLAILAESIIILGLLAWLIRENESNPLMRVWLSQNLPLVSLFLDPWVLIATSLGVLVPIIIWAVFPRLHFSTILSRNNRHRSENARILDEPTEQTTAVDEAPETASASTATYSPFYETLEIRSLLILVTLATQAIALWFVTASLVQISGFPPDAFYYARQLPFTYWWGLSASLAMLLTRKHTQGGLRTGFEILSLFVLALYLIGLPSLTYQDPRVLDSFQHEGNGLGLYNLGGWLHGPIWYVRQFPGGFTFFAQLTAVAGVNPFQIMKYYPIALSWILVLFVYTIARTYTPKYAGLASALFLSGMWFQLHISPQSIELITYLGILFVLLKLLSGNRDRKLWLVTALAVVPSFVVSHPETPIVVLGGIAAFLLISLPQSRRAFLSLIPMIGTFGLGLAAYFVLWWETAATETRNYVGNAIFAKAASDLSHLTIHSSTIPTSPAFDYGLVILMEEGISVTIWILGAVLLLFFRKFKPRESLLAGFLLGGVSTIPVALFARADVLQRSYLFSLFPTALLAVSLLERKGVFSFQSRSLSLYLRGGLIIMIIGFALVMPITRYGVDPGEYIPASSLAASDQASTLRGSSVLFLSPGDYAWRFYATLNGAVEGPKLEQTNISDRGGGYTKPTSALSVFNLTFTKADSTADYIMISDYYENLYALRFGSQAGYYSSQKASFETQTALGSGFSPPFNLVYSTGKDRIYSNQA